ncbi:MAG: hypothetical protein GY926_08790 [bacterium]|nr:hypothetical protein [bacterium]
MRYEELPPIDRHDFEQAMVDNDVDSKCQALLRLALHDSEYEFVRSACLDALVSREVPVVRGAAATALGHLARLHRRSDTVMVQRLRDLVEDHELGGRCEDALDDIAIFAPTAE